MDLKWYDPAKLNAQIGLLATSMLTLIAFFFTMTDVLPHLSYFTPLD